MENLIIEVSSEDELDIIEDDLKIVLKLSDYNDFVQLIGELNLLEDFQNNIVFKCEICNSFVISSKELHIIIEKVIDYLDDNNLDSWINVYESIGEILDGLREVVYLTDKDWNDYYTIGLPHINFIYEENGQFVEGPDGDPVKYVTDEVAFKLKNKCECTQLLERI